MSDREPLLTIHPQETVEGALRNALQIAQLYGDVNTSASGRGQAAHKDVARLLKHALAGLSEPNAAAQLAALQFVGTEREARDMAAVILNAALRGSGSRGEPTP